MDYSDGQEESIDFERTELQKDCHQEESISLDRIEGDEGYHDLSSLLEVVLKEEEGSFIPNYNSEELSDVEQKTVDDFIDRNISEDFKVEDIGSPTQKEIGSLSRNNCEDIDKIQKIEKRFYCWICEHRSKHLSDLYRHVKEVHLKYKPYHCGICGYRTYRTYTLKIHMLSVHKGIKSHCHNLKHSSTAVLEAPLKLDHQQEPQHVYTYSNKMSNLQDRVMNVNKMDKTFFCSFCHLRTKWACNLRNHIFAVHMKAKPHNCPICNYKSSVRYTLMRHIRAVHMKDKPHLCPLCPYKATRPDTLKVHMKRLHPEKGLTVGNSLQPK